MKLKWSEEMLTKLNEVNSQKKIPRYFRIKELIEEIVSGVENDYESFLDKIYGD